MIERYANAIDKSLMAFVFVRIDQIQQGIYAFRSAISSSGWRWSIRSPTDKISAVVRLKGKVRNFATLDLLVSIPKWSNKKKKPSALHDHATCCGNVGGV